MSETLKKLTTSLEGTGCCDAALTHFPEKREKLAARLQAAGIDALPDAINLNEKAIAQLKKCALVPLSHWTPTSLTLLQGS